MPGTEDETPVKADVPQFGLIDLVDAFTAFRHEYRTQVKESRSTNEWLQTVSKQLEQIAGALQSRMSTPVEPPTNAITADQQTSVYQTLIQFDIQWTRALEVIQRSERVLEQEQDLHERSFEVAVSALSPLRRWLSGPLIRNYRKLLTSAAKTGSSGAMTEGLNIVLAKLRQVLDDYHIARVETLGKPFDGQTMRSISSVVDPNVPAGHVAQELSPAYIRHGEVLKYADVRVSSGAI